MLQMAQSIVDRAVDRDQVQLALQQRDRRQEAGALQAAAVELIRRRCWP